MIPGFENLQVEDLLRVHPEWVAHNDEWTEIEDVRSRRIVNSRYIPHAEFETSADYKSRLQMTRFVAESPQARARLVSSLFSLPQDRTVATDVEALSEWMKDVDRMGTGWAEWLESHACPIHIDFGVAYALVDTPRVPGGAPYVCAYSPRSVRNWRIDEATGELEWVLIVIYSTIPSETPGSPARPTREFLLFDRTHWHRVVTASSDPQRSFQEPTWYPNGDVRQVPDDEVVSREVGPHATPGVVPLVPYIVDPQTHMIGPSPLGNAVTLDLHLLQLSSDQSWNLYRGAHPTGVLRSNKSPSDIRLGVEGYIHLSPEDDEQFEFVSPSTDSFTVRAEEMERTTRSIHRHVSGDTISNADANAETGRAMAVRFAIGEGRRIGMLGSRLENFEDRLLRLVAAALSQPVPEERLVTIRDTLELQTDEELVELLASAKGEVRSETFKREAEKGIVRAALGQGASEEKLEEIDTEIDKTEPPQPLPLEFGVNSDPQGTSEGQLPLDPDRSSGVGGTR